MQKKFGVSEKNVLFLHRQTKTKEDMEKEFNIIPVHFIKLNGVVVTVDICMQLNIRDMIDVCRFILEDNNPKYIECRFFAYGSIYRIENPFVYQVEK